MTKDTKMPVTVLDESTRRYYLDVMGVQCWQLLDSGSQQTLAQRLDRTAEAVTDNPDNDTDVINPVVDGGVNWSQLDTAIQQCERCPLHKTRKQVLAGNGNPSAELMFVVLAPELNDAASGRVLSAAANDLFAKMLSAINVAIEDVYITSLLKCTVPAQHTVSPHEIQQCNTYLKQQIQLIRPKLIIVLGDTAIRCLLQRDAVLDEFRELINVEPAAGALSVNNFESVPLFVSYSPDELLLQPENKRKAWLDLQQLQTIIET
jgi:DNA polymerase